MNNQRPAQGEPVMDRGGISPDPRRRMVDKIMDTLRRHVPVSGPVELHELRKVAERFEENIFSATTGESDYIRKISLKMLELEKKSLNAPTNALPSNSAAHSNESNISRL